MPREDLGQRHCPQTLGSPHRPSTKDIVPSRVDEEGWVFWVEQAGGTLEAAVKVPGPACVEDDSCHGAWLAEKL